MMMVTTMTTILKPTSHLVISSLCIYASLIRARSPQIRSDQVSDAALKDWARKTLPDLERPLEMAQNPEK
jgi:hypothetical protein